MKRRSGFILVLAILFLALLELLAISVTLRVPQGMRGAARFREETGAYLAADAGVQDTIAWLEFELEHQRDPEPQLRKGKLGDNDWSVNIEPDDLTYPNGNHSCRCYKLDAIGENGVSKRRIKVSIVQESFGRYARFINHWGASADPAQTVYFWGGPIYVNGPVHSNEYLWVAANDDFYDGSYPYGHDRLFDTNWVSCVNGVVAGPGAPVTDPQLLKIYSTSDSKKAPRMVERIEPPTLVRLKDIARGSQDFPAAGQLLVSADGGVCVSGNVDELVLEAGGSQRFRIGPNDYRVEESSAGVRWYRNGTQVGAFSEHSNGLIYVEGNVLSFHGSNVGDHTLVTDTRSSAERRVTLTGDVTSAPGSRLGIITDHLHLPDFTRLPRNLVGAGINTVRLEAALYLVGNHGEGGFLVDDMVTAPPRLGRLAILGCLIEGRRQRCAEVGQSSGWNVEVDHSQINIHNPAPFFPALPRFRITALEAEER